MAQQECVCEVIPYYVFMLIVCYYTVAHQVFLMVAFVACILKKPEINEEDGLEDEINPAHDEEVLAKTPENITGTVLFPTRHAHDAGKNAREHHT